MKKKKRGVDGERHGVRAQLEREREMRRSKKVRGKILGHYSGVICSKATSRS